MTIDDLLKASIEVAAEYRTFLEKNAVPGGSVGQQAFLALLAARKLAEMPQTRTLTLSEWASIGPMVEFEGPAPDVDTGTAALLTNAFRLGTETYTIAAADIPSQSHGPVKNKGGRPKGSKNK